MYQYRLALSLLLAHLIFNMGCQNLQRPQLIPQSYRSDSVSEAQELQYLRQRAQHFDPYPESGPAADNVRPPGYQKAPPEPSRARWYQRDQMIP